jgi:hypothetical protein
MQSLIIISAVVPLLAFVLVRLLNLESRINDVVLMAKSGPAKTLVHDIEKVTTGTRKDAVERYLGRADSPGSTEWIYYLDRHSGYLIRFDKQNCVESVLSWKS